MQFKPTQIFLLVILAVVFAGCADAVPVKSDAAPVKLKKGNSCAPGIGPAQSIGDNEKEKTGAMANKVQKSEEEC